jgi:hypothetical protein
MNDPNMGSARRTEASSTAHRPRGQPDALLARRMRQAVKQRNAFPDKVMQQRAAETEKL